MQNYEITSKLPNSSPTNHFILAIVKVNFSDKTLFCLVFCRLYSTFANDLTTT